MDERSRCHHMLRSAQTPSKEVVAQHLIAILRKQENSGRNTAVQINRGLQSAEPYAYANARTHAERKRNGLCHAWFTVLLDGRCRSWLLAAAITLAV